MKKRDLKTDTGIITPRGWVAGMHDQKWWVDYWHATAKWWCRYGREGEVIRLEHVLWDGRRWDAMPGRRAGWHLVRLPLSPEPTDPFDYCLRLESFDTHTFGTPSQPEDVALLVHALAAAGYVYHQMALDIVRHSRRPT